MNYIKKLASQTMVYGLSTIVGRLINYLLVPIYTRVFAPGEYGVVSQLYAYVVITMVLITYGTETGYFRFANDKKDERHVFTNLFSLLTITSLAFIFVAMVLSGNIAGIIGLPGSKRLIMYLVLILGMDAIASLPFARLRQLNKPIKFVSIRLINIGINVGLNLLLIVALPVIVKHVDWGFIHQLHSLNLGIEFIFISNLIASAVTVIMLLFTIEKLKFNFDKVLVKKILLYSLPLLVAGLSGNVNEAIDRILLKHFLPESLNADAQIGIYSANIKIAVLMTLFIQTFRYAADPFFFQNNKEINSKHMYAKVMTHFVAFGLLIFITIMAYLPIVMKFIGNDYREGEFIVPYMLISNLLLGVLFNLSIWYKLTNKTKYGAIIATTGASFTVIMNIVLIPRLGYYGSTLVHLGSNLIMVILSFSLSRRFFKIEYEYGKIFLYSLIALVIYGITQYVSFSNAFVNYLIYTVLIGIFMLIFFVNEYKHLIIKWLK